MDKELIRTSGMRIVTLELVEFILHHDVDVGQSVFYLVVSFR